MKQDGILCPLAALENGIAAGREDFGEHLRQSNERAVVRGLGNGRMEGDVRRGAISPTAHLFFLLMQYEFEFLYVRRCCSRCSERGHPGIEEHACFEDILEGDLRHRLSQALSVALGNKSARTRAADDERLKLHDSQGFANRRPADLHSFRQFALGWKLIAWLQFSPAYKSGQLHHDLFMQRPSLYFSQGVRHAI